MRLLAACLVVGAVGLTSACGGAAQPAPTAETAAPTSAPAAPKPSASAVPSPSRSAAASPTAGNAAPASAAGRGTVYVGNTDGIGVYVRKTAVMSDRLRAYPDGTPLTIIGDDADGDGQHWHHVKTPDGLEGYVPAMYTLESPP